jgi:hypothetical protein
VLPVLRENRVHHQHIIHALGKILSSRRMWLTRDSAFVVKVAKIQFLGLTGRNDSQEETRLSSRRKSPSRIGNVRQAANIAQSSIIRFRHHSTGGSGIGTIPEFKTRASTAGRHVNEQRK